jgi:hypothetical protein
MEDDDCTVLPLAIAEVPVIAVLEAASEFAGDAERPAYQKRATIATTIIANKNMNFWEFLFMDPMTHKNTF